MSRWREQYDRMKRAHSRLFSVAPSDHTADDYYCFFLFCFHLKDWLKNDPSVPPEVGNAAEERVNTSAGLSLCADVANGVKHFRAGRRPRIGADIHVEHIAEFLPDDDSHSETPQSKDSVIVVSDDYRTLWDAPTGWCPESCGKEEVAHSSGW